MQLRDCKKCYLFEMAEADASRVEEYKQKIKPADRVTEAEYERRLLICSECDFLNAGTCGACGCYVELRAFGKAGHCPKKRW